MGISKTSDHILINMKMPNRSQEPPGSSKAKNEDLEEMDVLCIFKTKRESQNFDYGFLKDHWPYLNHDQDTKPQPGSSSTLQSPKWGLKGHGCSLHLQIKIESQNLDHGYTKDQWPYSNQDPDAKPQSGTSSILQSPKSTQKTWIFFATSKAR